MKNLVFNPEFNCFQSEKRKQIVEHRRSVKENSLSFREGRIALVQQIVNSKPFNGSVECRFKPLFN